MAFITSSKDACICVSRSALPGELILLAGNDARLLGSDLKLPPMLAEPLIRKAGEHQVMDIVHQKWESRQKVADPTCPRWDVMLPAHVVSIQRWGQASRLWPAASTAITTRMETTMTTKPMAHSHKYGANRKELARKRRRHHANFAQSRDIREDRGKRQMKAARVPQTARSGGGVKSSARLVN